jgi:tellurite resistance-related uncharacterized protein
MTNGDEGDSERLFGGIERREYLRGTASVVGASTVGAEVAGADRTTTGGLGAAADASGTTVVEDFERSDPLADYGARTGLYSVTTSTVYEGGQALVNDGGDFGSAVSTSGLDAYPSRGDEFDYRFNNAADDNFVACHFFAQSETDNPDGYTVGISGQGAWRMWRNVDGSITQIASTDLPTSDQISGWYRAEVRTDDTTVYADLYDDSTGNLLASIQADDTNFDSGGIGFRSAGNGEVWDYAVQEPDTSGTVVEDFERADPLADYGAATNLYSVTTATVYEGSQALVNDGGDFGSAVSTSGLNSYPSRGDEITYWFDNAADDNFVALHFLAQSETDNPEGYTVGISGQGAWRMWRNVDGSISQIASTDLPTSDQIDGWYRAEVWTDDTTVYADLYDDSTGNLLASIQADDTSFTSGGIGFRSAGNGEVWDYVVSESSSGSTGSAIEGFERTDPLADYGGTNSRYSVTNGTAHDGDRALVNDGGSYGSVVTLSGLDAYPGRGDEITYWFDNAADDNFAAFHFFAQSETDNPDGYTVGISDQGGWRMWSMENGSATQIASADLPASEQIDGWYRAEVWTDDLTVYADLYDDSTGNLLASIQADDTTWATGGIGFRSAGNGEVWDHVVHEPDRDPNVLGGGDGYPRTVPQSEADYLVSTLSELKSAFDSASRGDVVYVDPAAEIYTGSSEMVVPEGITLASDRGIDGSSGGRLYTDQDPWSMLEVTNPDVRVTGLRIAGRLRDWAEYQDGEAGTGVHVGATGVEVDNCELYGFTFASVRVKNDSIRLEPHIHHNAMHHNAMDGWGYGVSTATGHALIEYNEFWHNRHSIAGAGENGYTARYNHVKFDAGISHHFDMHRPGGTSVRIHHNTFEPVYNDWKDKKLPGVAIRGTPSDSADIWNNWFHNFEEPLDTPNDWTDEAIIQVFTDSWQNVNFWDNHYGSSTEPPHYVGAPR